MTRKLGQNFEALEDRRLMTVGLEVIGGDLHVSGTPDGAVAIIATGENSFDVMDDGELVDSVSGVDDDIRINFDSPSEDAQDELSLDLQGASVDQIMINLGGGTNRTVIETGSTSGSVRYYGGAGHDSLEVAEGVSIGRGLSAYLRDGNDTVEVDGQVGRSVNIYGGRGDDSILFGDNSEVGRRLTIRAGAGDNTTTLEGQVEGSLFYRGGAGDDLVDILASAAVDGRTNLMLGAGDNSVSVEGNLGAQLQVRGGSGDDQLRIGEQATVAGNMRIRMGGGDNTVMQEAEVEGRVISDTPVEMTTPPVTEDDSDSQESVSTQVTASQVDFDPQAFLNELLNRNFRFSGTAQLF